MDMKNKRKKQNKKRNKAASAAIEEKKFFLFWEYNPKSILHNILFLLVAALLIASIFSVRAEYCDDKYRYIANDKDFYIWQSPYVKQLDAFIKGQLHLDVEPSEGLLALENPYDRAERDAYGVQYLWDHTFYNGKYYSYFGVAPVLTVHLPIYLLTGGAPSDAYAVVVLAVYAAVFLALAYREVMMRFAKKANLWLFLIGLCAFWAVSGVFPAIYIASFYNIPVVSALAFSMAFIFFAFRAMRAEKELPRCILLVFAALALGLTVTSRPSVALMCLPVFALFIEYLVKNIKSKKREWKKIIATVASFAVPLIICAGAVMWYNAARFSSPLDFGEKYQLTVNDVSENTLEINFILPSVFSYFLYGFWHSEKAPFMEMGGHLVLPHESRYVYAEHYAGAFAYVLPALAMLFPWVSFGDREKKERDITKNAFVISAIIVALFVAYMNFCKAGVNIRYVCDIVPMLSLVGVSSLLTLCSRGGKVKKAFFAAFCLLAFAVAMYTGYGMLEILSAK